MMHRHLSNEIERPDRAKTEGRALAGSPPPALGMLWFGGWLFTFGFAQLVWWKAILGLVFWPYFLGIAIR
jgi:hypothetical protein